jgi:hypothetical protein
MSASAVTASQTVWQAAGKLWGEMREKEREAASLVGNTKFLDYNRELGCKYFCLANEKPGFGGVNGEMDSNGYIDKNANKSRRKAFKNLAWALNASHMRSNKAYGGSWT